MSVGSEDAWHYMNQKHKESFTGWININLTWGKQGGGRRVKKMCGSAQHECELRIGRGNFIMGNKC